MGRHRFRKELKLKAMLKYGQKMQLMDGRKKLCAVGKRCYVEL